MVNTPCETLSNGNGSPIRQNPYKNKTQTLNVNGPIHLGGTGKWEYRGEYEYEMCERMVSINPSTPFGNGEDALEHCMEHTETYVTNAGVSDIKWDQCNDHEQQECQFQTPVKISRALF